MDKYHVYEAIGEGKHSTVYKGRMKKSIDYYAIKSVEKSQRSKVLQEVKMLNNLNHPNILKFYCWYETSAHFWLILEYCVGGDLITLLKQDKQLPEDSVHDLAHDVVKALQFLHSKGIIYCDLKPSNILLDENGCMKLCDFGLARKLTDVGTNSLSMLPHSKRGTPCYMAPELFQEGGVHSFASDFWALGCVLYECYTGNPPFVGNEFTQLVKHVLSDPLPPLPDSASSSFTSLVNGLLKKDPAERIQWPELCGHSFWRTKLVSVPLPSQPAFANMLQMFARPCLSEWDSERSTNYRTPPRSHVNHVSGVLKRDENNAPRSKVSRTPTKYAQSGKKGYTKVAGVGDDKHKEATYAKHSNILRLSRMAKLNLQRQNQKQNYRPAPAKTCENDIEVKIENNDMELDFSETPEDDAADDNDGHDNLDCINNEDELTSDLADEQLEVLDHSSNHTNISPHDVAVTLEEVKKFDHESSSEAIDVAATPPSFCPQRKPQYDKTSIRKDGEMVSVSSKSSDNLSEVFWHPSDLAVKPVMSARKADKASDAIPNLPYAIPANDYTKLPREELNALNKKIIDSLSESPSTLEKQNVLRYLEILSGNTDAANTITNSTIMLLLVKMLRLSKAASAVRIQLVALLGLLIRRATLIEADLANSGIVNALVDGLRDKQEKVRRYSMAALGELLFYISSLSYHMNETSAPESPVKENRTSGWQVSNSVITLVSSVLRKGEDDLTQLYALKTIDNICSQGGEWATRFAVPDVIGNLCYIYKAAGKQENTRVVAGSCLVRLARFNTPSIQVVVDKLSLRECASALIKRSPREKQISLNILNMALFDGHKFTNMSKHVTSLFEEKGLVPCLVELIDQGTDVLRGKALIFVALLCKTTGRWVSQFLCNSKLLLVVDRLAKGKDNFVQKCLVAFVHLVTATVPGILETVAGEVQQMTGGRRHGPFAVLTGRGNPRATAHMFAVILHLLASSLTKYKVVNRQVLIQLANLIKLFEAPFKGRDDFQITLLRVLEAISEEPSFILDDPNTFTSRIFPSLAVLYKGNKDGDARFLCLKILFDAVAVILNDMTGISVSHFEQSVKDLRSFVQTHFLPLYPILTEDEDPIPMYAQKLLLMLIEHNYVKVSDIMHPKTVSQCFQFLLGELSNANLNNVNLCLALVSAPEMETKILSQLRVVREIGNLLDFVYTKEMEDFLEPTLGLCKAFILRGIGSSKGIAYSIEPALLGNTSFDMSIAVDQQECIKDISDFDRNIGVFLELINNRDRKVADLASECLVLLLKAAPREATMGLFANLAKIADLLESSQSSLSALQLLRLLYGLSFACRQYLSQAMILALSVTAIKRIEASIFSFKDTTVPGVKEAVRDLKLELQRLPRFV